MAVAARTSVHAAGLGNCEGARDARVDPAALPSGPRMSLEYRHNKVPGLGWQAVTKLQAERKSPFIQTEWSAIPEEDGWRWGVLARAERVDDGTLLTHDQKLRVGATWLGSHIER